MNFITIGTIIICVIIYIIMNRQDDYTSDVNFLTRYSLIPMQVKRGEYYRLLTAGFLHRDFYHLLMNMFALYNIGTAIESYIGSFYYGLFLLISIIGGNLMVTYKSPSTSRTIGLSGGIYGLMMIYFVLLWSLGLFAIPSIRMSAIRVLVVNAVISFMPNVSLDGHLGGALTGIILGFLYIFILS